MSPTYRAHLQSSVLPRNLLPPLSDNLKPCYKHISLQPLPSQNKLNMADNMPSGSEYRTGRSDSTTSTTSTTSATSTGSATGATAAPPRRVRPLLPADTHSPLETISGPSKTNKAPTTQSSHVLFESLQAQKRRDDPASVARRQSFNEQRSQGGFLGQMWNKCVLIHFSYSNDNVSLQKMLTCWRFIQLGVR